MLVLIHVLSNRAVHIWPCSLRKQVLATGVLQDPKGTCAGQPGYLNQVVTPGDRLVRIGTRPVNVLERMQWWAGSDQEMLNFLNGPEGTDVALVLARNRDDTEYQVVLKRHVPAASTEKNINAPLRAAQLPNSQSLYNGPPISRTRLTLMGGVGVAVSRADEQEDYGPVLVHRVHGFTPMHGKICVGDRLCSINSEKIDHLPMKTIHALIDGKDGTRVSLQFEHVELKRSQHGPEGHHVPNMVAFWASKGHRGPKDIVTTESFDLIRSNGLPLSKAADEDDWSYNQADPTWQAGQAQEERGVGVLQVGIRAAKNLPKAGHVPLSAAGVFVRVTCADNSFSGDVVYENAVDPQFDHSFEIPVRANQQESDLILEVVHKEAFFADIPFGSLKLPKAAAFVSKNGTQDGWYGLANQYGDPIIEGFNGQRPLLHLNVCWLPVNRRATNTGDGSEFAKTLAPGLQQPSTTSEMPRSGTKGRPVSLSKVPSFQATGHGPVPVDHVPSSQIMRGRYCLYRMAEYAKTPYEGKNSGYKFENLEKDFLEDERFEAVEALMAILKLKEQLQASTNREHELAKDLQHSLNQIKVIVDQKQGAINQVTRQ